MASEQMPEIVARPDMPASRVDTAHVSGFRRPETDPKPRGPPFGQCRVPFWCESGKNWPSSWSEFLGGLAPASAGLRRPPPGFAIARRSPRVQTGRWSPAGRSGSLKGACPGASAGTLWRAGTCRPEDDRRQPRRRAPPAAAPRKGPCRGSSGWSRQGTSMETRTISPVLSR